jgi:hypothetical protein
LSTCGLSEWGVGCGTQWPTREHGGGCGSDNTCGRTVREWARRMAHAKGCTGLSTLVKELRVRGNCMAHQRHGQRRRRHNGRPSGTRQGEVGRPQRTRTSRARAGKDAWPGWWLVAALPAENHVAQRSRQAATGIGGEAGVWPDAWTPAGGEREREGVASVWDIQQMGVNGPVGARAGSRVRPVKDKERISEFRLIIFHSTQNRK